MASVHFLVHVLSVDDSIKETWHESQIVAEEEASKLQVLQPGINTAHFWQKVIP